MRVHRLILDNFRCFERLELELEDTTTLLIGANGSGKSAILDGMAIALGAWLSGTSQATREDRTIEREDARLVRQEGEGLATVNPVFPVRVAASGSAHSGLKWSLAPDGPDTGEKWARELRGRDGRTTHGEAQEIRLYARLAENQAASDPDFLLPLIAYYGTGRLWVQKRDFKRETRSRMDGYAACLEFASNHKLFEHWMRDREHDRVQRIASAAPAERESVRAPHLDAVEEAARSCLEGARRFFYSINHQSLQVEFADGRLLPFASLSDGQRSLIVLAADIAWRAVQLNPSLGADAPKKTAGVVLIDEIELHLHPQWQRTVIHNLRAAFPDVQFVISTHSPQVVSAARPEWLRVIHPDGTWARVDYTRGRDSNSLLRDVFGVPDRPAYVLDEVKRIEGQLAAGRLDEAREALERLEADLGPSDPVASGLRWELHDIEVNGPMDESDVADR
ncbi:MAG TPA: AAA family ATPase [Nannocystaceae bacterium]|nr:AAA family ATPase [Nannocystaceae bacterium]